MTTRLRSSICVNYRKLAFEVALLSTVLSIVWTDADALRVSITLLHVEYFVKKRGQKFI